MTTSTWVGAVTAVATDLTAAHVITSALGYAAGDSTVFVYGPRLRLIGSQATEPAARSLTSPLRQPELDCWVELATAGPYPLLLARGLTAEQISAGKAAIAHECGERAYIEGHALAFIAANGYEIIPPG